MDHEINHLSNEIRHTQGTTSEKDDTIKRLLKEIDNLHAEIEQMKSPTIDRKPSERKIEQVEIEVKTADLNKVVHQELSDKNSALEA
jgi:uncharacterized coiled-coil DUF342 family protein